MAARLRKLIEHHIRLFEKHEKKSFDRARRYYRGDFWSVQGDTYGDAERWASGSTCDKNLVYVIADTSLTSLLGPNPRVATTARNEASQHASQSINGLMDWVFAAARMRRRAALTLMDASLCKRGVFKTSWSVEEDRPVIDAIDPAQLFFDVNVRDPDNSRYWIEGTPVSKRQLRQRVDSGLYDAASAERVNTGGYPKWLIESGRNASADDVRAVDEWALIFEFYDRERGVVQHYDPKGDVVLMEDKLDYQPYSLYSLNHSGVDSLGMSEVHLILSQQRAVNRLLTLWQQVTYMQLPRTLFDAGRISDTDLETAMASPVGSLIGIRPDAMMSPDARFANLFFPLPVPETPEGVKEFLLRLEGDVASISAVMEAARGQIAGAKTATEMAIIDAYTRSRLAVREGHLNDAIEDVARKCLYLCRRYMSQAKQVRVAGNRRWDTVSLRTLRDVDVDFEVVAYNPLKQNPAVMAESLLKVFPLFARSPITDIVHLYAAAARAVGMPADILLPEHEARQVLAAAAAAPAGPTAAPPASPPASPEPPMEPPTPSPASLAPEGPTPRSPAAISPTSFPRGFTPSVAA